MKIQGLFDELNSALDGQVRLEDGEAPIKVVTDTGTEIGSREYIGIMFDTTEYMTEPGMKSGIPVTKSQTVASITFKLELRAATQERIFALQQAVYSRLHWLGGNRGNIGFWICLSLGSILFDPDEQIPGYRTEMSVNKRVNLG